MIARFQNINATKFSLNGIEFHKVFMAFKVNTEYIRVINVYDSRFQLLKTTKFDQIEVNGNTYANASELISNLSDVIFSKSALTQAENEQIEQNRLDILSLQQNSSGPGHQHDDRYYKIAQVDNIQSYLEGLDYDSHLLDGTDLKLYNVDNELIDTIDLSFFASQGTQISVDGEGRLILSNDSGQILSHSNALNDILTAAKEYADNLNISSDREIKLVNQTTQYTFKAEDVNKFLIFTGGTSIPAILPRSIMTSANELRGMTIGATILNFVPRETDTPAVQVIPQAGCNPKTIGDRSVFAIRMHDDPIYSIFGTLDLIDQGSDYEHPTQNSVDTNTLSGASVISRIAVNEFGHVIQVSTRSLSGSDLPENIPAPKISQSSNYRFVTDAEKEAWNNPSGYTHPTQNIIDAQTSGANIISRVRTNDLGHVVQVSSRTLTPADLGAAKKGNKFSGVPNSTVDLSSTSGYTYAFGAPSTASAFAWQNPVENGVARVFISRSTKPSVTNANEIFGHDFEPNTKMELVIESPDGISVQYYFLKI